MSDRPVVAVAWLPLSRAMICCSCETVLDISYRACWPGWLPPAERRPQGGG